VRTRVHWGEHSFGHRTRIRIGYYRKFTEIRVAWLCGPSQHIDVIGVPKGDCTSSTDQCGAGEVGHFSFRGFSRVFGITVPPTQHLWSGPLMQDPCASTWAAFWVRRADCRPSLARRFSAFSCPVGPAVDIGRVGALWALCPAHVARSCVADARHMVRGTYSAVERYPSSRAAASSSSLLRS